MCMSSPSVPAPPPPPQEFKQPDNLAGADRRKRAAGMGSGTLLTGATGVASGSLNTGGSTLLGG